MNASPLSDELHRIADAAPRIDVDPSTWNRARAARRRDRSLVAGGVSVVAAALVAAILVLPGSADRSAPPVADTGSFPTRIRNLDLTPLPDLRAGTAAAAYVTALRHVVLVGGASPTYRAIDIQERTGAIALSPDGTKLAYGYRYAASDPRGGDGPRSGLGILDLTTGETQTVPIALRRQDIVVDTLVWDDLGFTLAYVGSTVDTGETTSGLLRKDASKAPHLVNPTGSNDVGVLVNGIVTVATGDRVDAFGRISPDARPARSATSPSSGDLVGSCTSGFTLTTLRLETDGTYSAQQYDDRHLDLAASGVAVPDGLAGDVSVLGCVTKDPSKIVPLGTPSRLLVQNGRDLALATLGDDASYDVVARVDPDLLRLSVATRLVE